MSVDGQYREKSYFEKFATEPFDVEDAEAAVEALSGDNNYRARAFEDLDTAYRSLQAMGRSIQTSYEVSDKTKAKYYKCVKLFNEMAAPREFKILRVDQVVSPDQLVAARNAEEIKELLQHIDPDLLATEYLKRKDLAQALFVFSEAKLSIADFRGDEELDPQSLDWIDSNLMFQTGEAAFKDDIEAIALSAGEGVLGLGYKSANLLRLQGCAERVSEELGDCTVEVPGFLPLGDFEMASFVRERFADIDTLWEAFCRSFNAEQLAAFLDGSNGSIELTEEGKRILEEIRTGIEAAFKQGGGYLGPQLDEWLSKRPDAFVIVRSTGKEDSDTNSNAGGNASIPFIQAKSDAVSDAMGDVLSSYFGEKSILQRLSAGDKTIFQEPFFLPVLIQEMVGEEVDGRGTTLASLPRSGVIFTCSPEMGEGITKLSVGLGNNEGVVSSRVGTDSVYIDGNHCVQSIVSDKATRFVARENREGKIVCEPIENRGDLASARSLPALDDAMAVRCKKIADFFSKAYGTEHAPKPLDIEFSVIGDTIHLLQARPLMQPKQPVEPSYLDQEILARLEGHASVRGETLVPGGSYVREIRDNKEWLVCPKIEVALDIYLRDKKNQAGIKTVIVYEPAPGTSHAAVTFRSKGVSVIIVQNRQEYEALQTLHNKAFTGNLWVDPQNGQVVHTNASTDTKPIKEGYYCYPIPLAYSMKPTKLTTELEMLHSHKGLSEGAKGKLALTVKTDLAEFQKKMESLQKECLPRTTPDAAAAEIPSLTAAELDPLAPIADDRVAKQDLKELTAKELIHEIAHGKDPSRCKGAVAKLLKRLETTWTAKFKDPTTRPVAIEMILVAQNALEITLKQVIPAINDHGPGSLERLYPVRLLESCLFQRNERIKGGFSIATAGQFERNEQKAVEMFTAVGVDFATQSRDKILNSTPLLKISKNILNSSLAAQWSDFLRVVMDPAFDAPRRTQLIQDILRLEQQNLLLEWANTALPSILVDRRPDNICQRITENLRSMSGAFEHADRSRIALDVIRQGASHWGEAGYALKEQHRLTDTFKAIGFDSPPGPVNMERLYRECTTNTGKICLLNTWRDALRLYDELIKIVKASSLPPLDRAKAVQKMLGTYGDMCKQVLSLAQSQTLELMSAESSAWSRFSIDMVAGAVTNMREDGGRVIGNLIPQLANTPIAREQIGAIYQWNPAGNLELKPDFLRDYTPDSQMLRFLKLHTGVESLEAYMEFMKQGALYQASGTLHSAPGIEHALLEDSNEDHANLQLLPSVGFNVGSVVLGQQVQYDLATVWPSTLEDYFTTFHQNMESFINKMKGACGFRETILPEDMSPLLTPLKNLAGGNNPDEMSLEGGLLKLTYAIRLRQHAATLRVSIDRSVTPNAYEFKMEYMGGEEHGRWNLTTASNFLVGSDLDKIKMEVAPGFNLEKPTGATVTIKFKPAAGDDTVLQISAITRFLNKLNNFTSDDQDPTVYIQAAEDLRRAIHPEAPRASLNREEMKAGGLFAAPALIQFLQRGGEPASLAKAQEILGELRAAMAEPGLSDLSIKGSINFLGLPTIRGEAKIGDLEMLRV